MTGDPRSQPNNEPFNEPFNEADFWMIVAAVFLLLFAGCVWMAG